MSSSLSSSSSSSSLSSMSSLLSSAAKRKRDRNGNALLEFLKNELTSNKTKRNKPKK
jgi:hypothetical protein